MPIPLFTHFTAAILLLGLLAGIAILVGTIFWIIELVDVLRRDFRDPTMKIVWFALIFFTHFIGATIYYFVGKRDGTMPGQAPYSR